MAAIKSSVFKVSAFRDSVAAVLSVCLLLMTQSVQAASQPVETEIGAIIQGRLEETDSRLSAGQYADAYTFAGSAGEEILLNLASSDFDGFLSLLNSEGDLIGY